MKLCVLILLVFCTRVNAQEWSAFAGAGIGYDALLRDKTIQANKSKWPFELGFSARGGLAYQAANGFNVFASAIVGYQRIKVPVPEISNSGTYLGQLAARFLAGSGPVITSGSKGNTINPFLQLGAGFISGMDFSTSANSNELRVATKDNTIVNDNWAIMVGAGVEWRFAAVVPSGIGFQFTYTPLNAFQEPIRYTAQTKTNTYDLAIQGKLLQFLLSYSVHWKFKQGSESSSY